MSISHLKNKLVMHRVIFNPNVKWTPRKNPEIRHLDVSDLSIVTRRMANPYLQGRHTSHFEDMPNPYAYPSKIQPRTGPMPVPTMVTALHPLQPDWQLQRRYTLAVHKVESPDALPEHFSQFKPQNLEQECTLCLGIPSVEEPELLALDLGQWQRDADVLLQSLSHAGNSFQPTDRETRILESSSLHEKKVQGAQAVHSNAPRPQGYQSLCHVRWHLQFSNSIVSFKAATKVQPKGTL
jgi:hypothetical protein